MARVLEGQAPTSPEGGSWWLCIGKLSRDVTTQCWETKGLAAWGHTHCMDGCSFLLLVTLVTKLTDNASRQLPPIRTQLWLCASPAHNRDLRRTPGQHLGGQRRCRDPQCLSEQKRKRIVKSTPKPSEKNFTCRLCRELTDLLTIKYNPLVDFEVFWNELISPHAQASSRTLGLYNLLRLRPPGFHRSMLIKSVISCTAH